MEYTQHSPESPRDKCIELWIFLWYNWLSGGGHGEGGAWRALCRCWRAVSVAAGCRLGTPGGAQ